MELFADDAAADLNFIGSFRKLVDHVDGAEVRAFGPITAYATGLPIALFNGAVLVRPAESGDIDAALRWLSGLDLPYEVFARSEQAASVASVAATFGLTATDQPYPGMVLPAAAPTPTSAPGVAVRIVSDAAAFDEHLGVLTEGGLPTDVAHRMFPTSWLTDPDVRMITGLLDGRPVGTGLAIRTGSVSGVYNIGTLPGARRRGVGSAITVAAIDAGRGWGCDLIVLQATEMGEPLYRELGFRTIVRYTTFTRRPAPQTIGPRVRPRR
jgi:GNAT superfamily N-acetyltransferase